MRAKHLKRGTMYKILGVGQIQSSGGPVHEGDNVVIYQSEDGNMIWVRPTAEFNDGRFEYLNDN